MENIALQSLQMLYTFVLHAKIAIQKYPNLQTLEGYIFYIFYNILQPNFAILLILVCPSREYTFLLR